MRFFYQKLYLTALIFCIWCIFAPISYASPTKTINYQGQLKDNTNTPITIPTTIRFSIYTHPTSGAPTDTPSSSGPLLWSEIYDGGGCAEVIPNSLGIISVRLGSCTPFPSYLTFNQDYYLGLTIESNSEATPRLRFSSVPYAENVRNITFDNNTTNAFRIGTSIADYLSFNSTTGNETITLSQNTVIGTPTQQLTIGAILQGATPLVFEGATVDSNRTTIAITDPTGNRIITLPDNSGTVAVAVNPTGPITLSSAGVLDCPTCVTTIAGLNLHQVAGFGNLTSLQITAQGGLFVYEDPSTNFIGMDINGILGGSVIRLAPDMGNASQIGYIYADNVTSVRNLQFPDASGTIALTSDLASLALGIDGQGISFSGGQFNLGGGLNVTGNRIVNINGGSTSLDFIQPTGSGGDSRLSLSGGAVSLIGSGDGSYNSRFYIDSNGRGQIQSNNGGFTFLATVDGNIDNSFNILSNRPGFQGLTYANDYSANFLARSLVDKGYVDAQILSAGGSLQAAYNFGGPAAGRVIDILNSSGNAIEIRTPYDPLNSMGINNGLVLVGDGTGYNTTTSGIALSKIDTGFADAFGTIYSSNVYDYSNTNFGYNAFLNNPGSEFMIIGLSQSMSSDFASIGLGTTSLNLAASNIGGGGYINIGADAGVNITASAQDMNIYAVNTADDYAALNVYNNSWSFPYQVMRLGNTWGSIQHAVGQGDPNGFVTAYTGSVYYNSNATSAADALWVKTGGFNNTGWSAISGGTGPWSDDGVNIYPTALSRNVGIGTNTPAGILHVLGGEVLMGGNAGEEIFNIDPFTNRVRVGDYLGWNYGTYMQIDDNSRTIDFYTGSAPIGGGSFSVNTGSGSGGDGGSFFVNAGTSDTGLGGSIELNAGSSNNQGGYIGIQAGFGAQQGGSFDLQAGYGQSIGGGNFFMAAGNSDSGGGGRIEMFSGSSNSGRGGDINFSAGYGPGGNGTINLFAGSSFAGGIVNIGNDTGSGSSQATELRLNEARGFGTDYVGFKAPDDLLVSTLYTLPYSDGLTGQVLSTNGSGILSWVSSSGGGTLQDAYNFGGPAAGKDINIVAGQPVSLFASGDALRISNFFQSTFFSTNAITANAPFDINVNGGDSFYRNISGTLGLESNNGIQIMGNTTPRLNMFNTASSSVNNSIFSGLGSPEGVIAANSGSLFMRTDGVSPNEHLYLKTTDSATTGWVQIGGALTPDLQAVTDVGAITTNSMAISTTTGLAYLSVSTPDDNAYLYLIGDNGGSRINISSDGGSNTASIQVNSDSTTAISTEGGLHLWLESSTNFTGIGTNFVTHKLTVNDVATTNVARFNGSGSTQCTVVTGTGWSCTSDERLKDNIVELSFASELITGLRPVSYNWKSGGVQQFGFIAQEVQQILPEIVTQNSDGYLSLNTTGLIPYIIKSQQEQIGEIENIKLRLDQIDLNISYPMNLTNIVDDINFELLSLKNSLVALENQVDSITVKLDSIVQPSETFAISLLENSTKTINLQSIKIESSEINLAYFTGESNFAGFVTIRSPIRVTDNTAGKIILPSGATKVDVSFPIAYSGVPIITASPVGLYSLENPFNYSITNISIFGFSIQVNKPLAENVEFNWIAVDRI